jgi:hypothetical protein
MLGHQEERVRNRHKKFYICIAFALVSALSALAQSGRLVAQQADQSPSASPSLPERQLNASLIDPPATAVDKESMLPDAPSAAKADDTATPEPAPVPEPPIRKGSEGAPAAATGPSLERVADRHFWTFTGLMFGASVMDAELTQRCQQEKTCSYVPPSLRSRAAMYGIGLPADFAISYLTYNMKSKHSRVLVRSLSFCYRG